MYIEPFLHPRDKSHLIMVCDLYNTHWIQFVNILLRIIASMGFSGGSDGKEFTYKKQETWVQSLGREETLEKGLATHSSFLAWRIPWTEEPGGQRVRHDWMTNTWISTLLHLCLSGILACNFLCFCSVFIWP